MNNLMKLTDSVPLLKRISDLATKPSATTEGASKPKLESESYLPSPGLPKSPRVSTTLDGPVKRTSAETIPSDNPSKPVRGQPFAPENMIQGRRNAAPTGHLIVSLPTEMNHRSQSHVASLHADSRDDSHYDESVGQFSARSSVYITPPATPASKSGEDMDDIIIHRYLAEKNKVKASEAKHAALQVHVIELNRHIEEQHLARDREQLKAQTQIQKQEQATSSLEQSVNHLQVQLLQKESQKEEEIKSIKAEAERQTHDYRNKGIKTLESLRRKLGEVNTEYSAAQLLLEEESQNLLKVNTHFKEMKTKYDKQTEQSKVLQSKLAEIENEREAITRGHSSETSQLQHALENVNEMLSFQDEKGAELSNELKLMSCQYVNSMDKADQLRATSSRLTKELDAIETRLKEELKKNVLVTNQLEEMARGFIDTDAMLGNERATVKRLSSMLTDLRDEFADEKSNSEQLASDLNDTNQSLTENKNEVLKLSSLTTSLNVDLDSVKKTLAKALHKVKSLTNGLKESVEKRTKTEELLKTEQESVARLTAALQESNIAYSDLSNDLVKATIEAEEGSTEMSELSREIDIKKESLAKISALLVEERSVNESTTKGHFDRITALSDELSPLKEEFITQGKILTLRESNLSDLNEKCTRLENQLKEKTKESCNGRSERDDLKEKVIFQEDTVTSLTSELSSLEQKHSMLFGNLVETESKLQSANKALEESNSQLERKDAEFEAIENMFKEEIAEKDVRLKEEQDNASSFSTQLLDKNQKHNSIYSNLVSVEEKLLKKEEASKNLMNRLSEKEKECKTLTLSLDREKNGTVQRKLKVAKKMIKAEKDRHQAILKEVEAKNIIIGRIETQSQTYLDELGTTKKEMQEVKEKKATHSARALQDLHRQLDDERKNIRTEKEDLRSMLRREKLTAKSLTMRINALEGSNETGAKVSQALKKEHEDKEQVRQLATHNETLKDDAEKYMQREEMMKAKLIFMEGKIIELIDSMDTMTQFCGTLEGEKKTLKAQLESARNPNSAFFDVLENSDTDLDDEDTVDTRSLSDYSLAQTPAPRQTQREFLMKRTHIKEKVYEEGEDVELTVDTRHLYEE